MVKQHTRETYELLFDSASGDIEAYKQLFERYGEKLYNFVYYLTYSREESEDITSEAFIKVFEALQGRDVTSFNFQAYLYKTAKNFSLNAIARRKREGLTLEEAEEFADASVFSDPEKATLLTDQREKVKDASEKLTSDQQAALLLKELENLPYDTIAEVLDSNPNAVGALLSRARLKFKEVYRMTHAQTEGIPDACEKITPLLSAYIDKEASTEQIQMIEDHLASCPICNANLESMSEASTTYRSLVPILPLATFKVWSAAKGALVGGKVAAWAGATTEAGAAGAGSAAAGATTAATTGSTGIMAAIGSSLAYKVTAVVVAGLVAAGIGVVGYFGITKVAFAKKQVPSLIGLKEQPAKQKVKAAGLKCTCKYSQDSRTGNEVVTEQSLKPGTKVDKGTKVSLTMRDKEMEAALQEAEKKIGEANNALREVQGMSFDTSDLAQPMQNAQAKHDGAKTVADLTGVTNSSVFWSDSVINGCNSKKQAYLAEQERIRKEAEEKAKLSNFILGSWHLYYDGNDMDEIFSFQPDGICIFTDRGGDKYRYLYKVTDQTHLEFYMKVGDTNWTSPWDPAVDSPDTKTAIISEVQKISDSRILLVDPKGVEKTQELVR